MAKSAMRSVGFVVLVGMSLLAVVTVTAGPKLLDMYDDRHPAAPAPADLCAAIGPSLFEKLVPGAVPQPSGIYSSGSDAACEYDTVDGHRDGYGRLRVRVLRYGSVGWRSGDDRASEALEFSCKNSAFPGQFSRSSGFGDEMCAVYSDQVDGGTGSGSAVIRRGADLFSVDYYVHPGTYEQARQAVAEVAAATLRGVP